MSITRDEKKVTLKHSCRIQGKKTLVLLKYKRNVDIVVFCHIIRYFIRSTYHSMYYICIYSIRYKYKNDSTAQNKEKPENQPPINERTPKIEEEKSYGLYIYNIKSLFSSIYNFLGSFLNTITCVYPF